MSASNDIIEHHGPIIESRPGHFERFSFLQTPMTDDTYDFAEALPRSIFGINTWRPATDWLLPDGLVVGDVRHEAARGPLWPDEWTAVRRAVLEVVS